MLARRDAATAEQRMRYSVHMTQTHKSHAVRISTLVPPEVADVYRRAAELTGKSLSQLVREALDDHATATRVEAEITSLLEENRLSAATAAYLHLAKSMHGEAVRAMNEAVMLAVNRAVGQMDSVVIRYGVTSEVVRAAMDFAALGVNTAVAELKATADAWCDEGRITPPLIS